MNQPTTFINPDPDFALALGLAQSLVGGSAHITAGLGAILAGEAWLELSDYGRIVPARAVSPMAGQDSSAVLTELLEVLDRLLTGCDGLEEALRITRARDLARSAHTELTSPTTFVDQDGGR